MCICVGGVQSRHTLMGRREGLGHAPNIRHEWMTPDPLACGHLIAVFVCVCVCGGGGYQLVTRGGGGGTGPRAMCVCVNRVILIMTNNIQVNVVRHTVGVSTRLRGAEVPGSYPAAAANHDHCVIM